MYQGNDSERANRLPSGAAIFTIGALILVVAAGAFLYISIQTDAKAKAVKRAEDLKMLKQTLIQNSGNFGQDTIYPRTFIPDYRDYRTKKDHGWFNECDYPQGWIPNLSRILGNLPKEPTNACRPRIGREPFPRYQYISDGFNFKIAAYKLGDEVCSGLEFSDFVDPVRPCGTPEASWAVFTEGASEW